MNMFDEARSISGMLSLRGMTQSELADFLGVSQSYIANKIRLLGFSADMQSAITEARISERHARAMLRLPEALRPDALEKIKIGEMTVSESEIMIDCMLEENSLRSIKAHTNYSERIGRFERGIELGIDNLRRCGIEARADYERRDGRLTISIAVLT